MEDTDYDTFQSAKEPLLCYLKPNRTCIGGWSFYNDAYLELIYLFVQYTA